MSGQDEDAPMKALISGLAVFRDLLFQDQVNTQEKIIPGFMLLRNAMVAVMADDYPMAKNYLEQYASDFPSGAFARAVSEMKTFNIMTLAVPSTTKTTFCLQCRKMSSFAQFDDSIYTCEACGHQIKISNKRQ